MNDTLPSISPPDLANIIGTAGAPIVIDVRSAADLAAIDRLIPGPIQRARDDVEHIRRELPAKRPVVVCDLSGSQTSWMVVDALRRFGADPAIHSHMLSEQPRLIFMHFWANDDAIKLAKDCAPRSTRPRAS